LSVRASMTLIVATSRTGNSSESEPLQLQCAAMGKKGYRKLWANGS
jgi:hypothetical protein